MVGRGAWPGIATFRHTIAFRNIVSRGSEWERVEDPRNQDAAMSEATLNLVLQRLDRIEHGQTQRFEQIDQRFG